MVYVREISVSFMLVALLMLGGCAAPAQQTVLSLQGIDCQSCGMGAVQAVQQEEGVVTARYKRKEAEVHVSHANTPGMQEVVKGAIEKLGHQVVLGEGKGSYAPFPNYPEGADVGWLTKEGAEVDVPSSLVEGKVTVVDFYAPWCGPCRKVDAQLIQLFGEGADFALRKINIVDWDTPVVKQMGDRLSNLPMVEVYGPDGQLIDRIVGVDSERLLKALEKGAE